MACWLGYFIPSSVVLGSKPLGGSKIDLAFHSSEVNQMSTRKSGGLSGKKKKLPPRSGSVALRQLNPEKGTIKLFLYEVSVSVPRLLLILGLLNNQEAPLNH